MGPVSFDHTTSESGYLQKVPAIALSKKNISHATTKEYGSVHTLMMYIFEICAHSCGDTYTNIYIIDIYIYIYIHMYTYICTRDCWRPFVTRHWRSVPVSMLTLFMAVSGGLSWTEDALG